MRARLLWGSCRRACRRGATLLLLGAGACNGAAADGDGEDEVHSTTDPTGTTTGDSDSGDSTDPATTASTEGPEASADTTETGTTTTGGSFLDECCDGDVSWGGDECDPFFQDCPEGEKCVAYAADGQTVDTNKCVPILGNGQIGDPCMGGDPVEATDDCGADSFCFQGLCAGFCMGTIDDPQCPPDQACLLGPGGALELCLSRCNPLAQDCPDGQGCQLFAADQSLLCLTPVDPAAVGEPCVDSFGCAAGSLCLAGELLPACMGASCCVGFCDLDAPDCALPGTACVALYDMGQAPAGLETVGVCVLP